MAIITISRVTFSGGRSLAERVAERLGYPCLSREMILHDASKEYGVSEAELKSAMDEPPPFWQQVPGKRISYLKFFTAVLLDRANCRDFVYHGHLGHVLLKDITHLLRVQVIADMEYRIRAAMAESKMGREEAIAYIQRKDRERDKWMRFLYGLTWGDPALYDVVLNLEKMSIDTASEAIICITQHDDFKTTPESRKALKDLTLSTRVWASLASNDQTKAASIKVTADDGTIVISGSAGSQKVLHAILATANQVQGVKEVRNEMGIGGNWYW